MRVMRIPFVLTRLCIGSFCGVGVFLGSFFRLHGGEFGQRRAVDRQEQVDGRCLVLHDHEMVSPSVRLSLPLGLMVCWFLLPYQGWRPGVDCLEAAALANGEIMI